MPKNTGLFPGGTTSAHAENTPPNPKPSSPWGNYLRVRGEYGMMWRAIAWHVELPPRARRIPLTPSPNVQRDGTTSACAENTVQNQVHKPHARNYLRVRGEYCPQAKSCTSRWELPPRARRIRGIDMDLFRTRGTTSACAENTCTPRFPVSS